jgi:hypothetical protein
MWVAKVRPEPMKNWVAILLILFLPLGASSVPGKIQVRPHFSGGSSNIKGVVVYADGETPVVDLDIRVWDAVRERTVFKTKTDGSGVFAVPQLKEGRFCILAGSLMIDLKMFSAASATGATGASSQAHHIVIAMPRASFVAMAMPELPVLLSPLVVPPDPPVVSP